MRLLLWDGKWDGSDDGSEGSSYCVIGVIRCNMPIVLLREGGGEEQPPSVAGRQHRVDWR